MSESKETPKLLKIALLQIAPGKTLEENESFQGSRENVSINSSAHGFIWRFSIFIILNCIRKYLIISFAHYNTEAKRKP